MEEAKMIVPDHRIPKSVSFLRVGGGGWLGRAAEYLRVDSGGVPYLAGTTPLVAWAPALGSYYNNSTTGYVQKLANGKLKLTLYFLCGKKEADKIEFARSTMDAIVGRDALIPIDEYEEYNLDQTVLTFDVPGGPPTTAPPVPKVAAGGSATYMSRF